MGNPLKKVADFILTSGSSRTIGIIVILIIAAAIPLTVIVSQQQQEIRQRAAVGVPAFQEVKIQRFDYDQLVRSGNIKPVGKILQVNLVYNQNKSPTLSISKIEKKNGYIPQNLPVSNGYNLSILDKDGNVLSNQYFLIPNRIYDPPPLPGEKVSGGPKNLSFVEFALNVPFYGNAASLKIFDPNTQLIITTQLTELIPSVDNKPNFRTVPGTEFLKRKPQGFLQRLQNIFSHSAFAANNDNHLDIAIIPDQYSDMNAFNNDADAILSHVLNYEPVRTRASQIWAHYIDNTTSLGCHYDSVNIYLLLCNDQLVIQQVNNAGAPWDKIYVLVNNSNYGGSGGTIAVGYNGLLKGPMFAHEFIGHSFGGLLDEYNLFTADGNIDNQVHGLYDNDGNCYAGAPPAAAWQGIVNLQDYNLGCNYGNWYRSSSASIMSNLESQYFNFISQAVLNRRLDAVAGPFSGTPSPKASPCSPIGDVNGDGIVSIGDAQKISRFTIGLETFTESQKWRADVDGNGSVTIGDSQKIERFLIGLDTFAACTADTDADLFKNPDEIYFGINPWLKCSLTLSVNDEVIDNWPPDLNDSKQVELRDINSFIPVMGLNKNDPRFNPRFDLNKDGVINNTDILKLIPTYNTTCN